MGWIVFSIVILAIVVLLGQIRRLNQMSPPGEEATYRRNISLIQWIITGVFVFLWGVVTLTHSVHSITRGHDGLVETFGKITGHRQNGFALTAPWQSVEIVNVQQQSICADGNGPRGQSCDAQYEPFSSESIDVHVKAVLTYQVDSNDIQALYTNIGPNYVTKIILPNMNQILKEEVVRYTATDIVPNRQKITDAISNRMNPILKEASIKLVTINLTNIDFDDSVKKAIEQKVIAAQQAQASTAQVQVKEAEAKQAVAVAVGQANVAREAANGAADAQVARARGEAEANNLINASLTPQLIQMRTIDKLAGNISVVGIPTSNGTIFDLGGLLTRPAAPAAAPAAPAR